MVLPKEEADPKVEDHKEEKVATIDLISRINSVQVTVNCVAVQIQKDIFRNRWSIKRNENKMERPNERQG